MKTTIILIFIGILISLFAGLVFLFKDQEKHKSKRTLFSLGLRVTLAVILLGCIFYGLYSGELTMDAPWQRVN